MTSPQLEPRKTRSQPVSVWDLPSLLEPLYANRRTTAKPAKERRHFAAILAFVHRNRFAIGSQIQRRFANVLRSDRTTRRHLEELQSLELLDVVPTRGLGPNFPKVYFVTAKGVRMLRKASEGKGAAWQPPRIDRPGQRRREGYGAETVLHELLTTEFLLAVWENVASRPDLELLTMQRRSLARHPSFQVTLDNRPSRIVPDAMILFRQAGRGMACSFVEMDNGTMNRKQLQAKFRRYVAWSQSESGRAYLTDLYQRHGATDPRPTFRLLVVTKSRDNASDDRRLEEFLRACAGLDDGFRRRLWLTTVSDLKARQADTRPLDAAIWRRPRNREAGMSRADGYAIFPTPLVRPSVD